MSEERSDEIQMILYDVKNTLSDISEALSFLVKKEYSSMILALEKHIQLGGCGDKIYFFVENEKILVIDMKEKTVKIADSSTILKAIIKVIDKVICDIDEVLEKL